MGLTQVNAPDRRGGEDFLGTVWRAGFFSGVGLTTFVFAFAWVFDFGFGTLAWALGFVGAATLRDGLAFSTGAFVDATDPCGSAATNSKR